MRTNNCTLLLRSGALALLMLALICLQPAPVLAVEMEVAAPTAIIIGGDCDYPPYEFLDKDGKPAGYNVDLSRAIADVMGMQVEFRFGGWSDIRSALMNGSVNVLQGISYSAERTKILAFSLPHTIINHAVFARKGTPPVNTLEQLRGKEIIVFEDGIMHDYLKTLGCGLICRN